MNKKFKLAYDNETNKIGLFNQQAEILDDFKPGFYRAERKATSPFSSALSLSIIDRPFIPNNVMQMINFYDIKLKEIEYYMSEESTKIHKSLNMLQKAGLMFYGKQGTGKTTVMYGIADYFVKNHNAMVIISNHLYNIEDLKEYLFDKIGSDVLKVVIVDECEEEFVKRQNSVKKILDSPDSLNRTIFLFATNYVDKIPSAIIDRPSRIKYSIEMESIEEEDILFMLMQNINNNIDKDYRLHDEEVRGLVSQISASTIDELKHEYMDKVLSISLEKGKEIEKLVTIM